jgi:dTDP-4-amino-4,6-dideoxygalactose transaminase
MEGAVTVKVPLNDPGRIFAEFRGELTSAISTTLASGRWLTGPRTEAFAASFRRYVGTEHCVPVANGTDALELAMRALLHNRRARGREVITVANAGGYAVTACRLIGLTPVFADIDARTLLMCIPAAVAALGPETALIVATHLYGSIVDVAALRRAVDAAGFGHVPILEDCAQAHGGRLGDRRAGSLGDVAAFSFYPTKNLPAMGDAGAVVTSDAELAETVRRLRQYGWAERYRVAIPGGRNSRMDETQATVLTTLLPHLDRMNACRRAILAAYREAGAGRLCFPDADEGSAAHLAVGVSDGREELRRLMSERGIATDVHYPVLDCDQSGWRGLPRRIGPAGLDVSRRAVAQIVTLPCFPSMTEGEIEWVVAAVRAWATR